MEAKTNAKKEITMKASKANLKTFLLAIPIIIIFSIPYFILWDLELNEPILDIIIDNTIFIVLIVLAGGIIHESIHGLFWSFFLEKGFRSIKIGATIHSPYCHSKEPMKMKYYRLGSIMPCILLGLFPTIAGIITGSFFLFIFGVYNIIASGGDLIMLWKMRNEDKNALVQDHPDKIGCFIFE